MQTQQFRYNNKGHDNWYWRFLYYNLDISKTASLKLLNADKTEAFKNAIDVNSDLAGSNSWAVWIVENKKFADQMREDFKMEGDIEGYNKGEWIIFDFDDVIVHSFIPSAREKYNLDKLWKNKKS